MDHPRKRRWFESPPIRAASILAAAAALLNGAGAVRNDLIVAFRDAPRSVFSPEFLAQRDTVTRTVPAGEFLLHISATPETWASRLWQRVLYPRNPTVVVQPPFDRQSIRTIQKKYAARFAISAGTPPFDPGYRWRVTLVPVPGQRDDAWFGELAP
jgi:hypothetical protein